MKETPSTIMRFNLIGNLMNPAPNGLFVRYEDHTAALAQQAQNSRAACVPPGFALVPMRLNRAMNEVLSEDGWRWEDLLQAGEAIGEADHEAISRNQPSDAEIMESFLVLGVQAGPAHIDAVREILGNIPPAPAPATGPVGLEHCPITGMKFWGNIDHPEHGLVPTYGGPFDTYTIPTLGDDGEMRSERFDQDAGDWVEGGERAGWFSKIQPKEHHTPWQAIGASQGAEIALVAAPSLPAHTGVGNLRIMAGFGRDMRPMFNPGDPLLVDTGVKTVDAEGVYFCRIGSEGFIKVVKPVNQPGGDGLMLRMHSKDAYYPAYDVSPNDPGFEVLGKVLAVWKGATEAVGRPESPRAPQAMPTAQDSENLLASFWSMLRECESKADSNKDAVLRLQVEGYYRQWNHLTGQDHAPAWVRRAAMAVEVQSHGA